MSQATTTYSNRSNALRAATKQGLNMGATGYSITKLPTGRFAIVLPGPTVAPAPALPTGITNAIAELAPAAEDALCNLLNGLANTITEAKAAAPVAPPAPATTEPTPVAMPATRALLHKEMANKGNSMVVKPVDAVHNYLAAHGANLSRKEAITNMVAMGINYFTARTQYQRWFNGAR